MKKSKIMFGFYLFSVSLIQAQSQGFFLNDWQTKTCERPDYITTPPTLETATVTVNVDFNNKMTKVSKYVYGNNGVGWAGKMNEDATLMNHINNLSPNLIRWPGGNLSNEYFWDAVQGNGPKDIPSTRTVDVLNAGRTTANWAMSLENYYDMLTKTNSKGIICVNYSYARYGTSANPVANAAHYAANWVRFDKGRTKFWEIGNENYGDWEAGYDIDITLNKDNQPKTITGDLYGKHCRVFIDSMRFAASQIGSDIKIGVVAMETLVTYNAVQKNWNAGLMPQIADKADFLILHSYYTPYNQNSTVATILNSAANTKGLKDYVLNDLKTFGNKETLPIALTEWNIFATGSKQSVSYINGMHAALVLGEAIKNQFGQTSRWDLMNGWANGDDHGMFASADEPGVTLRTPHPVFYYMYYFQKFFGDQMINSTVVGSSNIVTYASSFTSGQSGIVLVNKGTTKQIVSLNIANLSNAKSYYRYVLTGGTDNGSFSRKVFVNGLGSNQEAGGPDSYTNLKALGTSINGVIKFEVPPLSVTYLLVTNDEIQDVSGLNSIKDTPFCIYPNPTKGDLIIEQAPFNYNQVDIFDSLGRNVFTQNTESQENSPLKLNLNLSKGMYFIQISGDNIHKTQPVLIY